MENEQNKSITILSKRTERKHLSILAFVLIGIINAFALEYEYFDIIHPFAYNLLMILTCSLLIAIIIFWIKGIIDFIHNGSSKILKKNLTNEDKILFNDIKSKIQWIKYLWIILFIILAVKTNSNPNTDIPNVENNSQTKTVETPKPVPSKPKKEEVKQSQPKEDLTWFAQYACQQEIKARAIYPPSVKVNFRRDNYIKGNSYTIYGTVDSQNAFGAMVRQNFACEAIIDKENDKYWVNDLNIE